MATHDYVIANASGAAVRADLNNALAAIVTNNSNATEPATTYAFQWWADTTASQLKLRNAANDDWVVIGELDGTKLMEDGTAAAPGLAFADDLDTGLFRAAANQLGIATNGIERVEFGTSEVVFNDGGEDIDFRIEGDTEPNLFVVNAGDDTLSFGGTITSNLVLANGSGIDFSATADGSGTTTSELLDDYEEGTFTPEYEGSSTAGSFTYSTQLGYYTKIGRQVFVEIILTNITEVSAGSGTLRVAGLPFSDTESNSVGSVRFDNFNFAAGTNYVVPVRGGDTFIQFQEVKSGGSDTAMSVTDRVNNLSDLFLSYTYTVD